MTNLPRAILIAFPLVLLAGKAANIVAGLGLKPAAASVSVLQLLPEQATTCCGGFSHLSSGGPAAEAVGPLSTGPLLEAGATRPTRESDYRPIGAEKQPGCTPGASDAVQVRSLPVPLVEAIIAVESGGNPRAIGDGGRAVGILQIHKCVVDDCNAVAGYERFTLADRLDPAKSREMFRVYIGRWCPDGTDEDKARSWNGGGPRGRFKESTKAYWLKVQEAMRCQK